MRTGKYFYFLFVFLVYINVDAQSIEDVFATVVYFETDSLQYKKVDGQLYEIWLRKPNSDEAMPFTNPIIGSGFFVTKNNRLFLVTAQHVAETFNHSTRITIRKGNDEPFTTLLFAVRDELKKMFKYSDDADVAVMELFPDEKTLEVLKAHFLPIEMLEEKEEAPQREKLLNMIGFPLGLGTNKKFSPITSEVKPASGLLELPRFDNKKIYIFFLIDKPSVGGFSGAPVFDLAKPYSDSKGLIITGGPIKCVGLVHGTISDETGGKFGAIVPSFYIVKTINKYFE